MSTDLGTRRKAIGMTPDQQTILDAVSEGIFGADAESRATFCNDALLKMAGYRREEIVGKNLHDLLHHTRRDGSKYPESECPIRRTVAAGELVLLPDEVLWCKDGSCFSVEYRVRPVGQPQGETKYVATLRDVTDVQQAKEGLRHRSPALGAGAECDSAARRRTGSCETRD